MAAIPPIRSMAEGRTSMQPPAAPATRDRGSAALLGGYSMKKKKTKLGIKAFSAIVSVESRTISDVRSRSSARARRTRVETLSGACTISASVRRMKCADFPRARASPSLTAQSLPVQPGGKSRAEMTSRRSSAPSARAAARARSAVPSSEWSSTRMMSREPRALGRGATRPCRRYRRLRSAPGSPPPQRHRTERLRSPRPPGRSRSIPRPNRM